MNINLDLLIEQKKEVRSDITKNLKFTLVT